MKKLELEKLINDGLSIREMSKSMNTSFTTIRYWLKKYDLKTNWEIKSFRWEKENLKIAIENSECKSDVLRFLKIKINSGNFQTLDRYIKKYNLDVSKLKYDNTRGNKFPIIYDNNDVFIKNSLISTNVIKKRIIKQKLLEYKCTECGLIDEWKGRKLVLHLDHKNGNNRDHRIENLRFLCPNCHSQTETYCNKKRETIV